MRPRGITLALVWAMACESPPPPPPSVEAGETKVVLLGTGTPTPDPTRSGPAVAVVVGDRAYLVDLGAGVIRRAQAAADQGMDALAPARLGTAFITHLHSDHTLGYADFLLTPWVVGRRGTVQVYGPPGLQAMTDRLLEAYALDQRVRTSGLEGLEPLLGHVAVHEIEPGVIYRDDRVEVTAFLVRHGSWDRAFGYRFDTGDRRVVISGDAAPSPAIVEQCGGCDVLVHEVYSAERVGRGRAPPAVEQYYRAFHTSTRELGALAVQARPELLVLYHQLYVGGVTDQDLLREVRRWYPGRVVAGRDLEVW